MVFYIFSFWARNFRVFCDPSSSEERTQEPSCPFKAFISRTVIYTSDIRLLKNKNSWIRKYKLRLLLKSLFFIVLLISDWLKFYSIIDYSSRHQHHLLRIIILVILKGFICKFKRDFGGARISERFGRDRDKDVTRDFHVTGSLITGTYYPLYIFWALQLGFLMYVFIYTS